MTLERIAYLGSSTALDGGSELCLLRTVHRFSGKFEVTLFLPDEGPLYQETVRSGIETVNLSFPRLRRYRGLEWFRWCTATQRAYRRLIRELKGRRIQMVHFNDVIDLPYYRATKTLRIPGVAHLRLILKNRFARSVYRLGVRHSGVRVLAVSEAARREMVGSASGLRSRILYDPEPERNLFHPREEAPGEDWKEIRRQLGWSDSDFVVLMVSKLLPNKGHLNFCRVARRLSDLGKGKFRFLMIAGHTPDREGYANRVRRELFRIGETRARLIPGVPHRNLAPYLRTADVLVHLPDTEDSFPGVVLEGMACGVPVVAHGVGGIPEQLDHGRSGVIIPRGEVQEAAEAIKRFQENPTEPARIRDRALERVRTVFSAENHFRSLEDFYLDLFTMWKGQTPPRTPGRDTLHPAERIGP